MLVTIAHGSRSCRPKRCANYCINSSVVHYGLWRDVSPPLVEQEFVLPNHLFKTYVCTRGATFAAYAKAPTPALSNHCSNMCVLGFARYAAYAIRAKLPRQTCFGSPYKDSTSHVLSHFTSAKSAQLQATHRSTPSQRLDRGVHLWSAWSGTNQPPWQLF